MTMKHTMIAFLFATTIAGCGGTANMQQSPWETDGGASDAFNCGKALTCMVRTQADCFKGYPLPPVTCLKETGESCLAKIETMNGSDRYLDIIACVQAACPGFFSKVGDTTEAYAGEAAYPINACAWEHPASGCDSSCTTSAVLYDCVGEYMLCIGDR